MARTRPITTEETGPARTVPFDLLDVTIIEEVSDVIWKRILTKIGYPIGLGPNNFTTAKFIECLSIDGAPEQLIEVLRAIHDLGTDEGMDAIKSVALIHNTELGTITGRAPRDAAAELWLTQHEQPELREVYARIQMQAEQRRSPRSFREFRGKEARRLTDWAPIQSKLERAIAVWCKANDFGDHVDIRGYIQNGDLQLQVVHGHRIQKPVVVRDNGHGRRTIDLRPAHCDVIRYESRGSSLRISPRSASGGIFDDYRRILGLVFFDDEEFFSEALYTLRSLQERGQAALDAAHSVSRARVIDLVWERGGTRHRITGRDSLAAIREMGIPPTEGDFLEAKIALALPGRREARRMIHIKLPNKVDYPRDDVHARAIESFIEAAGICVVDVRRRARDLWDLYPWTQPERTWRDAYPDDVDALVRRQVLTPVDLFQVVHPDRPAHGRSLNVNDGFGVSLDEEVPPRLTTTTETSGLGLQADLLLNRWREALCLEGEVCDIGDGLHILGERSFESVRFAIAMLLRQPRDSDAPLISQRVAASTTHSAKVALLLPVGRKSHTGLAEVPLDRLIPDEREVWRKVMIASSVGPQVPAIWLAPRDARIVVDKTRMHVWYEGIDLKVPPDSLVFKFIAALADAHNAPVTTEALEQLMSRNRDESFARKVKNDAKKLVEARLKEAGISVDADSIFVTVRGQGYRLGVAAYIC